MALDPAAIKNAADISQNPTLFAAFVALSFGLMKLLEITITALVKKYSKSHEKPQQLEVQIDPELTERVADMSTKITLMHGIMSKSDNDGMPMVYSSRSGMEAVRDIAVIIRNVSQTQERLAVVMDRLEQKFSEHDRHDATIQNQIHLTLERLLKAFDDHDRRVSDMMHAQNEILRLSQKNNDAILHISERE